MKAISPCKIRIKPAAERSSGGARSKARIRDIVLSHSAGSSHSSPKCMWTDANPVAHWPAATCLPLTRNEVMSVTTRACFQYRPAHVANPLRSCRFVHLRSAPDFLRLLQSVRHTNVISAVSIGVESHDVQVISSACRPCGYI